jgi:Co/Zn/Cd efflux system component
MLHDQMNRPHEDHRHVVSPNNNKSKEHDLGLMGILIHVAGDAANNLGVILAGAIIWKTTSPGRFYVDPAVSMAISFMIFGSAVPFGQFHHRQSSIRIALTQATSQKEWLDSATKCALRGQPS